MKKVTIVMTYFERPAQLRRTLKSIAQTKYPNFEVIIVDDGSIEPASAGLASFPITIIKAATTGKGWQPPEPAYNRGLNFAMLGTPDVIILQNAECYHVGDVISAAAQVTDDNYISFGCFSIDEQTTKRAHDITALVMANDFCASHDGQCAWYNHPQHRPVGYDFCSAITAKNMQKLNGYDERFINGHGYGDDYLLARIKMLGLRVDITATPFVVHQWHYNIPKPENKAELMRHNKRLFDELVELKQPRAQRIVTENFKITYAEN